MLKEINNEALTFYDNEHIALFDMWGDDYEVFAAENIDGVNSVLWKFTDSNGGREDSLSGWRNTMIMVLFQIR